MGYNRSILFEHHLMPDNSHPELSLPPGPETPFTVNTDQATFDIIPDWLDTYGDVVKVYSESRNKNSYIVNNPEIIRHILVKNTANYRKGPGFERVKMLLGNGIIVSDGAFWRRQRRMIQPAFSKRSIAKLCQHVQLCNHTLMDEWRGKAERNEVIDLTYESNKLSLQVILRVIFSDDVEYLIKIHGSDPFEFLTTDSTRDLKVALKFRALIKLFQNLIEWRREHQSERHDFLDFFMSAIDKESDQKMQDKELVDELMTAIIAGHETSAIALNWTWYLLSIHSKVEQKALAEINTVIAQQPASFEQLNQLVYIKQVVSEALRLYPPVWLFSRTSVDHDQAGQYDIPADTDIFFSPYYMHRDEEYWQNPEKFDPERFTVENEKKRANQVYIPFSSGPRRCICDFFAFVESQLHFCMMLPEFKMQVVDSQSLELEPFINLRVKDGIKVRLSKR